MPHLPSELPLGFDDDIKRIYDELFKEFLRAVRIPAELLPDLPTHADCRYFNNVLIEPQRSGEIDGSE